MTKRTKLITVFVVPVGKPAGTREIVPELDPMKEIVGGWIEQVYPWANHPELALTMNEEGKILGLEPNCYIAQIRDMICGDFLVTKTDFGSGEAVSLSETEIRFLEKVFA